MGQPVYFHGIVPTNSTPTQIIELYNEHCGADVEPTTDTRITDGDEIEFIFEPGLFQYTVDGSNIGWGFTDNFEAFLKALATTATEGWSSYEGHEPEQIIVAYGPTPVARAFETVRRLQSELEHLTAAYTKAIKELQTAFA